MNEPTQAPTTDPGTEEAKTRIRPDLGRYVPAKSGNGKRTQRTDDFVARSLDGKTLDQVKANAASLGINVEKWAHLNNGQQRMLIGNAMRTAMARKEEPLTEAAITKHFGEPVAPYDADAAAAAKAAREAEAAAKKEAKEKAAKEAAAKAEADKAAKQAAETPTPPAKPKGGKAK